MCYRCRVRDAKRPSLDSTIRDKFECYFFCASSFPSNSSFFFLLVFIRIFFYTYIQHRRRFVCSVSVTDILLFRSKIYFWIGLNQYVRLCLYIYVFRWIYVHNIGNIFYVVSIRVRYVFVKMLYKTNNLK